jgi:hypothetical protein
MIFACSKCPAKAVWKYAPADTYSDYNDSRRFFCDECIKRGCSCQWINVLDPEDKQYTDNLGRLLPCVEYDYNEKGYNEEGFIE